MQESWGAELHKDLKVGRPMPGLQTCQVHPSGRVIHKGVNPEVDSYSAFFDNAKLGKTNLEELIRKEVRKRTKTKYFYFFIRGALMRTFVGLPLMCALVGQT